MPATATATQTANLCETINALWIAEGKPTAYGDASMLANEVGLKWQLSDPASALEALIKLDAAFVAWSGDLTPVLRDLYETLERAIIHTRCEFYGEARRRTVRRFLQLAKKAHADTSAGNRSCIGLTLEPGAFDGSMAFIVGRLFNSFAYPEV